MDSTGRFRYEYQLKATIGIGDEHDVTVTYKDPEDYADGDPRDDIEEETTFSVVEADISVTPAAAAPGQTISVEIGGMRPYTLIDEITVGRVSLLGNRSVTTNREGDAMVSDITVPYLDPGHYPLTVQVGTDTRVVEFEMLAEAAVAGVAVELPGAVSDLGDNLDAIFHFNNTSKAWTFYDPRPRVRRPQHVERAQRLVSRTGSWSRTARRMWTGTAAWSTSPAPAATAGTWKSGKRQPAYIG